MDFSGAVHGWGGQGKNVPPLPKICHTYPTIRKFGTVISYLKKTQKIYESRDTSLEPTDISNFSRKISNFFYIKKYMYRMHFDTKFLILLSFLESSKIVLIKKVTILMMLAKMATLAVLKIKVF